MSFAMRELAQDRRLRVRSCNSTIFDKMNPMGKPLLRQHMRPAKSERTTSMRTIVLALTALATLLPAAPSHAQSSFPARNVRIVVPYPAGGGTDVLGRLLAEHLARKWGQSVVIENSAGAAGNIGAAEVFRAAPDGHTLLIAAPGPIATNGFLYKAMPFDPKRWTAVALLATGPYVLTLRKSFEGATVKDLVAYAKANPGKLTAAHPGVGSVAHLAT